MCSTHAAFCGGIVTGTSSRFSRRSIMGVLADEKYGCSASAGKIQRNRGLACVHVATSAAACDQRPVASPVNTAFFQPNKNSCGHGGSTSAIATGLDVFNCTSAVGHELGVFATRYPWRGDHTLTRSVLFATGDISPDATACLQRAVTRVPTGGTTDRARCCTSLARRTPGARAPAGCYMQAAVRLSLSM